MTKQTPLDRGRLLLLLLLLLLFFVFFHWQSVVAVVGMMANGDEDFQSPKELG
jgi:hypothetical protein